MPKQGSSSHVDSFSNAAEKAAAKSQQTVDDNSNTSSKKLLAPEKYKSADEELAAIDALLNESDTGLDECMSNIVVVDGLPIVPEAKKQKLLKFIYGHLTKAGKLMGNSPLGWKGISMPLDEKTGKSYGFAFVEYLDEANARAAVTKLNNLAITKKQVLRANLWDDFERYEQLKEEYEPPQPKPFQERGNIKSWLLEKRATDQYVVRYEDNTDVYWNEANKKPTLVRSQRHWAETYVAWSPLGSYLVTFHKQGLILWGGPEWKKIMRFSHQGVKMIQFSPQEKYLLTYSPHFHTKDSAQNPRTFMLFNVLTGQCIRAFPGKGVPQGVWPVFQFSGDDQFLSRRTSKGVGVHKTSDGAMLLDPATNKPRSIEIDRLDQFKFCPSAKHTCFAAYIPEQDPVPARVAIIEVPSRRELHSRQVFQVSQCSMQWNPSGDYLGVKFVRQTRTKKFSSTVLEVFNMKTKRKGTLAVDSMELKDHVFAFAWEPHGTRFAIIHAPNPITNRPNVSFYKITPRKGIQLLKTIEKRQVNHIFWSPKGRFIVLAGLGKLNGHMEFFDADNMETMGEADHFSTTDVAWSPCGRFVTTVVSAWHHSMETGYKVWTFNGRLVHELIKTRFFQLVWRPRPPTLLSAKKVKDIEQNLDRYKEKYEQEDKERKRRIQLEIQTKRDQAMQAWRKIEQEKAKEYAANAEKRKKIWGFDIDQQEKDNWVEIEKIVEEVIDVQEQFIDNDSD